MTWWVWVVGAVIITSPWWFGIAVLAYVAWRHSKERER